MPRRPAVAVAAGSFLLGLAGLGLAIAQDAPPASASAPTGKAAPAATAPAKPAAKAPETSAPTASETASPAKPAAAKATPQRFEPTEKVRPDFDVAFPVDI